MKTGATCVAGVNPEPTRVTNVLLEPTGITAGLVPVIIGADGVTCSATSTVIAEPPTGVSSIVPK